MGKKDIYVTSNGTLMKRGKTIWFQNSVRKKALPIAQANSVYCYGEVSLNSKFLDFFTKHQVPIYFFNYYGFFSGQYIPRRQNVSGKLLINQVDAYQFGEVRLKIAKEFLISALHNMKSNLTFYSLKEEAIKFENFKEKLEQAKSVQNLMLEEAQMRQFYYKCFNKIIKNEEFEFIKRVKQPPDNYINCLISFGNSIYYTIVLTEILKTQLDPTISYLHEPFERRYSLNLDISEILKPIIVDRVIFKLINSNHIKPKHFDQKLNYCYLNDEGRKVFSQVFNEKIEETFKHKKLGRNISYRYLARLECYKLIKFFLEGKQYEGFKI